MKATIHPDYITDAKVTCACGNTFTTGSTQKEIRTELCSACHPFYTGKQKLVDTARRVEKFGARTEAVKAVEGTRGGKKERRAKRVVARKEKAEKGENAKKE